jgi:methionyl-tRNA formyltransferase
LRLVFAGTPEFARVAVAALHAAGHEIALVLTQPDRPAGRGMKLQASAVKDWALAHGVPVQQPRSLRLDGAFADDALQAQQALEQARSHAMVVAAYGLLLPQWVLGMFAAGSGLGCINIHASLLPRWRGAAPIHRAIEAGDAQTGISLMQMAAGLDTGDILLSRAVAITSQDTTASLHDRLAALGGEIVVEGLARTQDWQAQPQSADGVCYAAKVDRAQAALDWRLDAALLARRVRAFNPAPVAHTALQGEAVKVWAAHALAPEADAPNPPCGTVVAVEAEGIAVATGSGTLVLTELQRAGGKRLGVADFLRGFAVVPGQCFDPTGGSSARPVPV